jgi:hypothetical protein
LNSAASNVWDARANFSTCAIYSVDAARCGAPTWRTAIAPVAIRLRDLVRPRATSAAGRLGLVTVAISFAGGVAPALAANCPIVGGTVNVSGTSCVIPPGDTVNRITASTNSAVVANGVHVPVPFGVGVTSQAGSLITFGVDPSAGGSSIVSQFGGGGITVRQRRL